MLVVLFNKTSETNEGTGVECVYIWNRVVLRHCQLPRRAILLELCYVNLEFKYESMAGDTCGSVAQ